MENNFNLKKFLIENKLTSNSRLLSEQEIDIDSVVHDTFRYNKTDEYQVIDFGSRGIIDDVSYKKINNLSKFIKEYEQEIKNNFADDPDFADELDYAEEFVDGWTAKDNSIATLGHNEEEWQMYINTGAYPVEVAEIEDAFRSNSYDGMNHIHTVASKLFSKFS